MRKIFQDELKQVGDDLIQMSLKAQTAIKDANKALFENNISLAEKIIEADIELDEMQDKLDERTIDIIALQGPVASDLRIVVGALRISASIERMGDLARHIAQLVCLRFPEPVIPETILPIFKTLAELTENVAEKVTTMLIDKTLDLATQLQELNEEINKLHLSVFTALNSQSWQEPTYKTIDVTLASRYFERFADHGMSVASKVAYFVTGYWNEDMAKITENI